MDAIVVGISDLKIARAPQQLVTYALGSCVGICVFDPVLRIGGLAHIMLPECGDTRPDVNIGKYADVAVPELVRQLEKLGGLRARFKAKIAGGAQMFRSSVATSPLMQIGQRNVTAVRGILQQLNIPLIAQDVLLDYGRTLLFDPGSGAMTVKTIHKPLTTL